MAENRSLAVVTSAGVGEPSRSKPKCEATTLAGSRCHAPTVLQSGLCFSHDPAVAEKRLLARRKGGANRRWRAERALEANPTLRNVLTTLAEASEGVKDGAIAPAVGNSLASLGRAMIAGLQAAQDLNRVRELENLLDELHPRREAQA